MPIEALGRRPRGRRALSSALSWFTTPLLPEDYLSFVSPLRLSHEMRGRVVAVRPQAADSATLAIKPGWQWAGHRPGQYVTLGVEIGGVRHHRSYSLSAPPERPGGPIEVTVKAVDGGRVSTHLVHHTRPGTIVHLEQAQGEFVLPDRLTDRLLFITAGSGITPVMAILSWLQRSGTRSDAVCVHLARRPEDVIFGAELRALARSGVVRLHEHHTAAHGRPSGAAILDLVGDWAERRTWACGPGGMLDDLQASYDAAGVGSRLVVERFQAAISAAGSDTGSGPVSFTRSGHTINADATTPLLVAGEEAGVLLPSGCRIGNCRSCVGRLRAGVVRDLRSGVVYGEPGDMIQTCISAAAGPVEIEL